MFSSDKNVEIFSLRVAMQPHKRQKRSFLAFWLIKKMSFPKKLAIEILFKLATPLYLVFESAQSCQSVLEEEDKQAVDG